MNNTLSNSRYQLIIITKNILDTISIFNDQNTNGINRRLKFAYDNYYIHNLETIKVQQIDYAKMAMNIVIPIGPTEKDYYLIKYIL